MRFPVNVSMLILGSAVGSALAVGDGSFGIPTYNYLFTATLDTYQSAPALSRSNGSGNRFIEQLKAKLNAKYPQISVVTSQMKDNQVTRAAWEASLLNNSEMVMYEGRGHFNAYGVWDGYSYVSDRKFGGWTRWAFVQSSQFMWTMTHSYYGPHLKSAFNGAHAIFGIRSGYFDANPYQGIKAYNCGIFGCSHYRSEDKWNFFSEYWVNQGYTMWDAYKEAVKVALHQRLNFGIEPAYIGLYGMVNGRVFIGHTEKVTTIYNGPVDKNTLSWGMGSVKYGTPDYENWGKETPPEL